MLGELGASPVATTATVGDIIDDQCADLHDRRSPTYATDIESVAGRLPASFTGLACDSVTPAVVEAFYRQLAADGWGPHRVRRCHELLHGSFKRAARLGVFSINPMPSVQPPQIPDTDVHPPTPAQVASIVAAPDGLLERLTLRLAATTGARRGEVVALQWADLDDDRLAVRRSLAYTKAKGVHERPTKTGRRGQRVITIDVDTLRALREWRRVQAEMALAAGGSVCGVSPNPRYGVVDCVLRGRVSRTRILDRSNTWPRCERCGGRRVNALCWRHCVGVGALEGRSA